MKNFGMRFKSALQGSLLSAVILCGFGATVQAADALSVEQQIRENLRIKLPDLKVDLVQPSELPGLYEVVFGTNIVYVDQSVRYLLNGDLFDLQEKKSVTAARLEALRADLLGKLDEKDMIIYAGKSPQHTVTVFTDISCGYCRKLHSEIEDYMAAGIRIRYLAFPRAGAGSPAAKTAESVWCADDPNDAMTKAKQGSEIENRTCENPIDAHYALGQQFGINGTPALILDDGTIVPGYVPADKLKAMLDQRVAVSKK
jgi:thiol:disulfide interchange protein DsbC